MSGLDSPAILHLKEAQTADDIQVDCKASSAGVAVKFSGGYDGSVEFTLSRGDYDCLVEFLVFNQTRLSVSFTHAGGEYVVLTKTIENGITQIAIGLTLQGETKPYGVALNKAAVQELIEYCSGV